MAKRKPSMRVLVKDRRTRTLKMLESQLKRGSKPDKETKELIPLTDKDKQRIQKEIETLKERI